MKTLLLILALAFTVSFAGNASTVSSSVANKTENMVVSKTNTSASAKKVQKKKPHGKKHHKATTAKKTPAPKK